MVLGQVAVPVALGAHAQRVVAAKVAGHRNDLAPGELQGFQPPIFAVRRADGGLRERRVVLLGDVEALGL